jgi:hypothetical protein
MTAAGTEWRKANLQDEALATPRGGVQLRCGRKHTGGKEGYQRLDDVRTHRSVGLQRIRVQIRKCLTESEAMTWLAVGYAPARIVHGRHCPSTTNIAYLSSRWETKRVFIGLFYTLGRTLTYVALGVAGRRVAGGPRRLLPRNT